MRKIRLPVLLAAVVAVVAVGYISVASGGAVTKASGVHVVERATTDVITNGNAKADKLGNVLTFANKVYDASNKNRVGSDEGYCIRVVVGKTWECSWTTFLDSGSLSVQGQFSDAGNTVLAITGGTGAYAGARGTMDLKYHNKKGTAFDFVFHLK
jgi:allene oxide cyclase